MGASVGSEFGARPLVSKKEAEIAQPPALSSASANALTGREQEVLSYLAQGLTNTQIANQLLITRTTVNSYLRTIYSKLGVTSRASAIRYSWDHKLIE
ncbi:response regulator transcription factor [Reticulibacter mediterranei]|uniref:response regulator transcription factor n=1 Tax=Reticulibacter mediterranei TaxID=2778369 RepID=UPI001C691A55